MVEISIIRDNEEFRWKIENENVKGIIENMPAQKIKELVEMYILLGHTVATYASVQMSEESIKRYFTDIIKPLENEMNRIEDFRNNMPNIIKAELGEYAARLEEISKAMSNSMDSLSKFVTIYSSSKKYGELGEKIVLDTLEDEFKDDMFENVSLQAHYTDILAHPDKGVDVLIEVKNYENIVPSKEVKKFWNDIDNRGTKIGCFISLRTNIANIGSYTIIKRKDKLGIFMNVSKFTGENGIIDGIKLSYFIARKFAQYFKMIENERGEEGELRNKIVSISKEISKLENEIERLDEIRSQLNDISKAVKKSLDLLEEIIENSKNKISMILNLSN